MVNRDLPDFADLSNSAIKKTFHLHFKFSLVRHVKIEIKNWMFFAEFSRVLKL